MPKLSAIRVRMKYFQQLFFWLMEKLHSAPSEARLSFGASHFPFDNRQERRYCFPVEYLGLPSYESKHYPACRKQLPNARPIGARIGTAGNLAS